MKLSSVILVMVLAPYAADAALADDGSSQLSACVEVAAALPASSVLVPAAFAATSPTLAFLLDGGCQGVVTAAAAYTAGECIPGGDASSQYVCRGGGEEPTALTFFDSATCQGTRGATSTACVDDPILAAQGISPPGGACVSASLPAGCAGEWVAVDGASGASACLSAAGAAPAPVGGAPFGAGAATVGLMLLLGLAL
ncbi:MAG: hypothetical protein J3K34DRAFT_519354 [Monoraphidium minutum]|nr:MAG: hypothetical protein J3K34DRAFT_519354 [Monoraphidium minutum]